MCVYFQIKMSINKSFAKAKEKLEQAKHNSQIALENCTPKDEEPQTTHWYHLNSLQAWEHQTTKQLFKTLAPLLLRKEVAINNTAKLINFLLILITDS